MTITITHTYADGTLLHGTTRANTTKGSPERDVLYTHSWTWFRSLTCWGQRTSRDKPGRRDRIDATADAFRALGYEVTVAIDDTPQDMATAEEQRATQVQTRADAIEAKAARKAAKAAPLESTAREVLDAIPIGQPNILDARGRSSLRTLREKTYARLDKAHALSEAADRDAERAETARAATRRRYNPITVANRIKELESNLNKRNTTAEYQAKWARDLDYWRQVREDQIAEGLVVEYTPDMLAAGGMVKGWVGDRWWLIEKVNRKTVTIRTQRSAIDRDRWLTNKLELHRITGYLTPEQVEQALRVDEDSETPQA